MRTTKTARKSAFRTARNPRAESAASREKREAIERLRRWVHPGDTLWTVVRHVAGSGMSRNIDVYKFVGAADGSVRQMYLSVNAARALGRRMAKHNNGIVCGGTGMDMGFELVYSLGQVLFGDGHALKQGWI